MKQKWLVGLVTVLAIHGLIIASFFCYFRGVSAGSSSVIFDLIAEHTEGDAKSREGKEPEAQAVKEKPKNEEVQSTEKRKSGQKLEKKKVSRKIETERQKIEKEALTDAGSLPGEGSLQNRIEDRTRRGGLGEVSGQQDWEEISLRARYAPKPDYPSSARRAGIEGQVRLRALVDENGRVKLVEIVQGSGNDALDASARKTLKKWRFSPAEVNGKRLEKWCILTIKFELKK